jgi:hypothetical protein
MVSIPIQNLFLSPPTIFTRLEALPGNPYGPGAHLLDRPRGPINLDAFGFGWLFIATPAGVGRVVRNVTTFEETLAQVLEVKQDITGATLNGEVYAIAQDEGRQLFSEFPLTRINLWVAPATAINLYWVLVL